MTSTPNTQHGLTRKADNYTLHCGDTTISITCLHRAVGFEVKTRVENSDGSEDTIRTYDVLTPGEATDLAHAVNRCLLAALEQG